MQCLAINRTSADLLSKVHKGTNFSAILIKIQTVPFRKIHLKLLSVKRWPFCSGLNMLIISNMVFIDIFHMIYFLNYIAFKLPIQQDDRKKWFTEKLPPMHYNDYHMRVMESQISCNLTVCSTTYSGVEQRNIKAPNYWPFVSGIHQWLVDSTHKGPVM